MGELDSVTLERHFSGAMQRWIIWLERAKLRLRMTKG